MDKEQAKFLLSSFRPDGADASLPEFAEALKLAAEDRALGEWLAHERATDAAFAQALNAVPIPDGLREEILAVLEYDGNSTDIDAELDSVFAGGMASISPPAGLREQIITAMELEGEHSDSSASSGKDAHIWRWLSSAALAAAVAVGAFVVLDNPGTESDTQLANIDRNASRNVIGNVQPVAVHTAMMQMATKLTAPENINLKTDLSCAHDAIEFLDTKSHPIPAELPAGLEDAKLVGARDMYLDNNQPVSLLCFEKEGIGMVHLIVADASNLSDADTLQSRKSISLKNCYGCSKTQFNVAHWREGEKIYMILTKATKEDMVKLF